MSPMRPKTKAFVLSIFYGLSSFAQSLATPPVLSRPVLVTSVVEVELGGEGERWGQWNKERTKYQCEYGCGPHRSEKGNGYGNGKGDGPPVSSAGGGSAKGERSKGSSEGSSRGQTHHERNEYFRDADRYIESQSEEVAWREHRELISQTSQKWRESLLQQWELQKNRFSGAEHEVRALNTNAIEATTALSQVQSPHVKDVISEALPEALKNNAYLPLNRESVAANLQYRYQSVRKAELEALRSQYANSRPQSPQAKEAYKAGLASLREADQAYVEGLIKAGEFFEASAKVLLEFAVELNPITALSKDVYRAFVGKDPLTGSSLQVSERLLSGGFAIVGLVTLGESTLLGAGLKRLAMMLKVSVLEASRVQAIFNYARGMAERVGIGTTEALKNFLSIVTNEVGAIGDIEALIRMVKHPGLWSQGRYKSSVQNALAHYRKHRAEFPELNNAVEYVEAALEFISSPPVGTLSKVRANGDKILYHPPTNVFVVQGANEVPKTMFKPKPSIHGYQTNKEYFDAQN